MNETYLGVIAVSTLLIACVHVGLAITAYLALKRATDGIVRLERAAQPLLTQVNHVSHEAAESLAAARQQISRGGDAVHQILERVDETVCRVESLVGAPARQGAALIAGARAVVGAFRRSNGAAPEPQRRPEPRFASKR